jgi:GNAT superfamily N-acetyltransferase
VTEVLTVNGTAVAGANLRLAQWMAPAAVELRTAAATELCQRYGVDSIGPDPDGDRAVAMIILSILDGERRVDVGCAALIDQTGHMEEFSTPVLEVRRVYIKPQYRGNGYAKLLMHEVERQARRYSQRDDRRGLRFVLETGTLQPESMHLYSSLGYVLIDNYGEWKSDPLSRCFELILD